MNDPKAFEDPCAICKKEISTRLCKFVVDYFTPQMKFEPTYPTCELLICSNCAYEYGPFDFCPHHGSLFEQIKLPKELQRFGNRAATTYTWADDE